MFNFQMRAYIPALQNSGDCSLSYFFNVVFTSSPLVPYLPTPPFGRDMIQGQFFKRSLTGSNSEFSFSKTSCLTKAEETSLPWRENNWIHTFPKSFSAMWNVISLVQDLNSCHCVHFLQRYPWHHGHLLATGIMFAFDTLFHGAEEMIV